jgi:hypothetical protein
VNSFRKKLVEIHAVGKQYGGWADVMPSDVHTAMAYNVLNVLALAGLEDVR